MSTKRKTYTAEFKRDAIRLATESGNVQQTARNPGMGSSALHRWIREHRQRAAQGRPAFTGHGNSALSEQEARIKQLECNLDIARQERDLLEKLLPLSPKNRETDEVPLHPRPPQQFNLEIMLRVLEVSRSGVYAWRGRANDTPTVVDQELSRSIEEIHAASKTVRRRFTRNSVIGVNAARGSVWPE
jgi:transposase